MSTHSETHDASQYYIPHGSPWPIYSAITLFVVMCGFVFTLNGWVGVALFVGFALDMSVHPVVV